MRFTATPYPLKKDTPGGAGGAFKILLVEVGGGEVGAMSVGGGNARQCPCNGVNLIRIFLCCLSMGAAHTIGAEVGEVGGDPGATALGEVSGGRSPSAPVAKGCRFFSHRFAVFRSVWVGWVTLGRFRSLNTMSPKSSLGLVALRVMISPQKKILKPSSWRAVAFSLHLDMPSRSGNT